jgi:phage terminase large subunit-like protein
MSEEEWLKKRESFKRQGLLEAFYMEYQSSIHVDADSRKFKPEDWRVVPRERGDLVSVAMAIDPAISQRKGADYCVIAVVGMTQRGIVHVLDIWAQVGASPRDQVDAYFMLHFKWWVDLHGVESVAYQAALIHLLTEEMARQSKTFGSRAYFAITPILHGPGTRKDARIEGILAPRYAAGYITHHRRFPDLESEALDWPNGKKDHLDAVAMAVGLLDPVATFAGPEEDVLLSPGDYKEIVEVHQSQCP